MKCTRFSRAKYALAGEIVDMGAINDVALQGKTVINQTGSISSSSSSKVIFTFTSSDDNTTFQPREIRNYVSVISHTLSISACIKHRKRLTG